MLPVGLTLVGNNLIDNCPAVTRKDILRQLACLPLTADERLSLAAVFEATAERNAKLVVVPDRYAGPPTFVSRIAVDVARLFVIDMLHALHETPDDQPGGGQPQRSRLFWAMERYAVHPINVVAARVLGRID